MAENHYIDQEGTHFYMSDEDAKEFAGLIKISKPRPSDDKEYKYDLKKDAWEEVIQSDPTTSDLYDKVTDLLGLTKKQLTDVIGDLITKYHVSTPAGVSDPDRLVISAKVMTAAVNSFKPLTWGKFKLFGNDSDHDSMFGMDDFDITNEYLYAYKGTSITKKDDSTLTLKPGTYQISIKATGTWGSRGSWFRVGMKATNSSILDDSHSMRVGSYVASSGYWKDNYMGTRSYFAKGISPLINEAGNAGLQKLHVPPTILVVSGGDSDFSLWNYITDAGVGVGGILSIVKIG